MSTFTSRAFKALRRLSGSVVLAVVLVCAISSTAHASNFGIWVYEGSSTGGVVSIQTPCCGQYQAPTEITLHRTAAQMAVAVNAGIYQVGIYRSGTDEGLDQCGTSSSWVGFMEYRQNGPGYAYTCRVFGSTGGSYAYCHDYLAATNYSGGWYYDSDCPGGDYVGSDNLNWNPGINYTGGEINGTTTNCSDTDVNYGGDGDYWQTLVSLGGGMYVPALDAYIYEPGSNPNWSLGAPGVNHGFNVSHSGGC